MGGNTEGVRGWLKGRHVSVLDEWVQACVEWIHQEHQGPAIPGSQLCQMVYEQWLDSDLGEIARPCLPPGIKQARKVKLAGHFALQVNSIQDISSPAYAQLVKLQGRENENASVSAVPATQGKFEPKSSRLLMMSLTDGQEVIQAMEYKPVASLNPQLTPGTKILLSGDLQCRLGVILLTSAHVKILGGEVEALKETNAQEKVLARAIGVTPPEGLPADNNQNTDERGNQRQLTTTPATAPEINVATTTTTSSRNQPITDKKKSQNQQRTSALDTSRRSNAKQEVNAGSSGVTPWGHRVPKTDIDDFPDEDDGLDELMLEEIEMMERREQQMKKETTVKVEEDEWDVGDIDEEELLLAMEWESSVQQSHKERPPTTAPTPKELSRSNQGVGTTQTSTTRPHARPSHSTPAIKKEQQASRPCNTNWIKPMSNTSSATSRSHPEGKLTSQPTWTKSAPFVSNAVPLFTTGKSPGQVAVAKDEERTPAPNRPAMYAARFDAREETDSRSTVRGEAHVSGSRVAVATRIIKEEPWSQQSVSAPCADVSPLEDRIDPLRDTSRNDGQSCFSTDAGSLAKKRRIESESSLRRPFIYLINMAGCLKKKESCRFDIKGFIMTLVSSLSHNPTWSLTAKINDGTMSLDVDIADQVLTHFIGFTVSEMMKMKAQLKTTSVERATEIKNHIKQGISRCQQSLIDLSCIMTLEMKPGYVRPRMTAVRQPTLEDAKLLLQIINADS